MAIIHYAAGQGVRTSLQSVNILGQPTDPNSPVVTVTFPDGTTTSPAAVKDSLGFWHADYLIPATMIPGPAKIVWTSTGAQVDQNAVTNPPEWIQIDPA